MEERVRQLEDKVTKLQEVVMGLILLQDIIVQFKLRKVYPELDTILRSLGM